MHLVPCPCPAADFQERLRYYSLRRQAKEAAAQAAADADACTFRPDTGNAVQVLALSASRAGNLLERPQASDSLTGRRVGSGQLQAAVAALSVPSCTNSRALNGHSYMCMP